jgi:branched-chain amino acid transport system substrate-binding protein
MYEKGLRLWEAEVNARGGILGRKVELVVKDDASDPVKAAAAYSEFTAKKEADLLLGPDTTFLALAAIPALEKSQTPCLFPVGASDALWKNGKGLAFGVQSPLSEWPAGFFELISKAGLEQVALLVVDHPMSPDLMENSTKWSKRYGLELAVKISTGVKDLPGALDQIARSKADAVTVWGSQEGCAEAVRLLKRSAWKPKAIYISSCQGVTKALRDLSNRAMDGTFTTVPWEIRAAKAFPGGKTFVDFFRGAYRQDPDYMAASSYAGGQILEEAAAKAQSLDKTKIKQSLAGLDTVTILGRYGVDPSGMQLRQFPLTLQWQKGKREIVWPEDMRTAKPAVAR